MKNCLIIILALIFASQSMFLIIGAFLSGYCFGYYLFKISKCKNQKADIIEFFQVIIKNMTQNMELLTKNMH